MSPPLFRVPTEALAVGLGGTVVLDGPEGRHAGAVVRIRLGERIALTDGAGRLAACVVTAADKASVTAVVEELVQVPPAAPRVTVVQALPKSDRGELAVELATEAGADEIVPWQAERCVSRWSGPKVDKGHARWVAAAAAATKQSRRPWAPVVAPPCSTPEVLRRVETVVGAGGLALALHEEGAVLLTEAVPAWHDGESRRDAAGEVLLVVGPEGGLSGDEVAALAAAGAASVVLGPEIVRTSTAAALALAALGVLTGRWGIRPTTLAPGPDPRTDRAAPGPTSDSRE